MKTWGYYIDADNRPLVYGLEGSRPDLGRFVASTPISANLHKPTSGRFALWDDGSQDWVTDVVKVQEYRDRQAQQDQDLQDDKDSYAVLVANLGNNATTRADLDRVVRLLAKIAPRLV